MKGWKYVNIKVPAHVAIMATNDDIRELLQIFGIDADEWADASNGCSPHGSYEEGDIVDMDGNGLLSYDYMLINNEDMARIFRYC